MKKLLLPVLLAAWAAFGAAFPADQQARVEELIGRLSGFDFPSINAATDELIEIGPSAVPALRQALKSQDP
ncbi:MAG TPA: hypothetical protein PK636_04980, partial [bacterium]|nr:hypothetical protein [bacterium]